MLDHDLKNVQSYFIASNYLSITIALTPASGYGWQESGENCNHFVSLTSITSRNISLANIYEIKVKK